MALTKVKGSVLPDIFPGVIWMFAGSESQIEDGWQLCNGEGTTSNGIQIPDLKDRFVIGSGSTYDTGDTGGSSNETTSSDGSHSHTVTVDSTTLTESQMPSHTHYSDEDYQAGGSLGGGWRYTSLLAGGDVQTEGENREVDSSGSSSSHTHTASTNSTGSHSHTVDTLPPYYALAFIIKL